MAEFKTHISWGVFIGVILVIFGLTYSFFSGIESIISVFIAILVGSFLPDLDLDDGIPFQILFGLLGAGAGGLVFYELYQADKQSLLKLVIIAVIVFSIVRFLFGYIFKRFTFHRGIFHSIPAGILAGASAVYFLNFLNFFSDLTIAIGVALSIGYIGHLLLDEIYSSVNIQGLSFKTKKSLGSALKLYSSSRVSTFIVYALILFFLIKIN